MVEVIWNNMFEKKLYKVPISSSRYENNQDTHAEGLFFWSSEVI